MSSSGAGGGSSIAGVVQARRVAETISQRKGYGVRYDNAGKRAHSRVGSAIDAETKATEFLRARIKDLETQLASSDAGGGADPRASRQRIADLEAVARTAVATEAELAHVQEEVRHLEDECSVLREMADAKGQNIAPIVETRQLQSEIRTLKEEQLRMRKEQKLGISSIGAPSGHISEDRYNELVIDNNKLQDEIDRLHDGGIAASRIDQRELDEIKRTVEDLTRTNDELEDQLHAKTEENEVLQNELEDLREGHAVTDPAIMAGNSTEITKLRDALLNQTVKNRKLAAEATGADEMMKALQHECEEKEQQNHEKQLRLDQLEHNFQQIQQDLERQREHIRFERGEEVRDLKTQLQKELEEKQAYADMLQHVTNQLEVVNAGQKQWKERALQAEENLHKAHLLLGVDEFHAGELGPLVEQPPSLQLHHAQSHYGAQPPPPATPAPHGASFGGYGNTLAASQHLQSHTQTPNQNMYGGQTQYF